MAESSRSGALTLLRIKRKRAEEPLDGLVIDLPRKKHRDASFGTVAGFFKFAETVSEETFEDQNKTRDLETRISSITTTRIIKDLPKTAAAAASNISSRVSPSKGSPSLQSQRQYSIIKSNDPKLSSPAGSPIRIDVPPVVMSSDSTKNEAPHANFTLYDGIDIPESSINIIPEPNNPEMEVFSNMVRDYLSLEGIASTRRVDPEPIPVPIDTRQTSNDYVYDVFYYRRQDGDDSTMELEQGNIGLVMVRPEDELEFLASSDDEDDSDYDAENDPDSNDENNPGNDYPDASESSDSDWRYGYDDRFQDEDEDEW